MNQPSATSSAVKHPASNHHLSTQLEESHHDCKIDHKAVGAEAQIASLMMMLDIDAFHCVQHILRPFRLPTTHNLNHFDRRNTMPLVQIKGISGFLSLQQKQEIISKVTDAVVSVEGEGLRPVTWVIIEDVASGEWGVGGQAITTDIIRTMSQATG